MYRTALRNVLAHKGRLLMTALAIMLGTAFVAGTMVFSDTLGQAMKNSYSKSYSDVSVLVSDRAAGALVVRADQRGEQGAATLTDATVRELGALPGVQQARGVVSGFTGVADKKGNLIGQAWSAQGANFVPGASGQDSRYPLVEGRGPKSGTEIALDRTTAEDNGFKVGDTVRIAGNGPAVNATLTGVFTTDDPTVTSGGTLVLMDTATAQQTLLTPGRYSSVVLTAKPGADESALLTAVRGKLPADTKFALETGRQLTDEQTRDIAASTSAMKTMLLVFAAISLFVGIFIIANTFSMLIAQRIKELALLRAVGAARGQVTGSVLVEALLIGATASVAGLVAGVGIGAGMQALITTLSPGMPTGSLVIAPATVITALSVGVLVTVLSAVLPAVRASRIPPVAAMSSGDQPTTQKGLIVRNTIGSLITAGGLALILAGARAGKAGGRSMIEGGAPLTMIGIFVLLPLLSRPVIALVGPLLARLAGTPGKLARRNAVRNPRRTAATAAALTIGLTLVSAMTVLGASVNDAVDRSVTGTMKADYDVAMATRGDLSPELAKAIAKAPGVAASSPVTNAFWTFNGEPWSVNGFDADTFDQLVAPGMQSGSADSLKQGKVLIDTEVAKSAGASVGSTLTVAYDDDRSGTVTVGGVFRKTDMLAPVLIADSGIRAHLEQPYVTEILVKGKDGATAALKQSVKDATGSNPVIEVKSKQDMRDESSRAIAFALNMMYGLLGMSVVVAVLGVVNTLAMSVFERKREIGMLRAIGLDRRGIKQMVRLESVVISLFGAVIGVLLGCFLAWASNRTLAGDLPGLVTVIPYGKMLLFLALAGLVGMFAAIWPARRAAKLDILTSIKTD
ncbi:FtsX-like permease family protein [Kitasatospora sp. NPDC049258]|uniref:ABC transporter permease n=1 Tax=Kitasatospora sp. NPDC049258 TaxID=3155394 RepID=UPI0034252226